MFCTIRTLKTARKNHRCTYCGDPIIAGDKYYTWESVDDSWFHSKMHPECVDALYDDYEDSFDEYQPFDNERPVGADKFSDMVKYIKGLS